MAIGYFLTTNYEGDATLMEGRATVPFGETYSAATIYNTLHSLAVIEATASGYPLVSTEETEISERGFLQFRYVFKMRSVAGAAVAGDYYGKEFVDLFLKYSIPRDGTTSSSVALQAAITAEAGPNKILVLDGSGSILLTHAANNPGIILPSNTHIYVPKDLKIIRGTNSVNNLLSGCIYMGDWNAGDLEDSAFAYDITWEGGTFDTIWYSNTVSGQPERTGYTGFMFVSWRVVRPTIKNIRNAEWYKAQFMNFSDCVSPRVLNCRGESPMVAYNFDTGLVIEPYRYTSGDTFMRFTGCKDILVEGCYVRCSDNPVDTSGLGKTNTAYKNYINTGKVRNCVFIGGGAGICGAGIVPNEKYGIFGADVSYENITAYIMFPGSEAAGFRNHIMRGDNCANIELGVNIDTVYRNIYHDGANPVPGETTAYQTECGLYIGATTTAAVTNLSVATAGTTWNATWPTTTLSHRQVVIPSDDTGYFVEGDNVSSFNTLYASKQPIANLPYPLGISYNGSFTRTTLENVVIKNVTDDIITVNHPWATLVCKGCHFEVGSLSATDARVGEITIGSWPASLMAGTNCFFYDCTFVAGPTSSHNADMFIISNDTKVVFSNCVFKGLKNGQAAIDLNNTAEVRVYNCKAYAASGATTAEFLNVVNTAHFEIYDSKLDVGDFIVGTPEATSVISRCAVGATPETEVNSLIDALARIAVLEP